MKRKLMMGLVGVIGLLGMAAPAMAQEHMGRDFRRAPVVELRRHERREHRFDRGAFFRGERPLRERY